MSDQEKQKQQQESLIASMQENIRELEQVTEGLQNELIHKENVFAMLKKDNEELEHRLQSRAREENQTLNATMHRLEEEIRFLKRHHEIEINMMREQYERSLETQKLILEEKQARAVANGGLQFASIGDMSMNKSDTHRLHESSNSAVGTLGHPNTPPSKSRVKEIISTTQITFDKLKRDLAERDQALEEKNREIMKLKVANDELAQKFTQMTTR